MGLGRRDYMLIAASGFFTLGLSPYIGLVQAALVGAGVFFGVRALAKYQRARMLRAAGACPGCGSQLEGGRCPSCGPAQE